MSEITLEKYKQLVQEQGQALMDVIQSVSLGDLEVEIEVAAIMVATKYNIDISGFLREAESEIFKRGKRGEM